MFFIIIITIATYTLSIVWTWKSLGQIDKTKKIAVILIGMLATYIITSIIYGMSKNGVNYQEAIIEKEIEKVLIAIFTGINSLIILPYISKQLDKIHEGEIEQKDFLRKMLILLVVFIICMCLECGYLKDIQQGTLLIYKTNS